METPYETPFQDPTPLDPGPEFRAWERETAADREVRERVAEMEGEGDEDEDCD